MCTHIYCAFKNFQRQFLFCPMPNNTYRGQEDKTTTTDSPVRTTEEIHQVEKTDKEKCHHKAP